MPLILPVGDTMVNPSLPPKKPSKRPTSKTSRPQVFIVHGRNLKARDGLCSFLQCLGLDPLTWEQVVRLTKKPVPSTLEVVDRGFEEARIAVVLFTPDEKAQLRHDYAKSEDDAKAGFQPRQNVIFEAGMAFAKYPERTVLVCLGKLRLHDLSDLAGINYVEFDNSPQKRRDLVGRLKVALDNAVCKIQLKEDCIDDPSVAVDFGVPATSTQTYLTELAVFREKAILQYGVEYLQRRSHTKLMVYAPTGAWEANSVKQEWFQMIAGCLATLKKKKRHPWANMTVSTTLEEFIGVYGLPPIERDAQGMITNVKDFQANLDTMEDLLLPFNNLKNATMYYLPNAEAIPGSGAIIFEHEMLFVGFATSEGYLVNYGIAVPDQRDITDEAALWFINNVKRLAQGNVIQLIERDKTTVKQGFNKIRADLKLPLRTTYRFRKM
jgi:predicted nucleotide-binding protein